MANVDNHAIGTAVVCESMGADQQSGDFLDGFLRRAKTNSLQPALGQRIETLQ